VSAATALRLVHPSIPREDQRPRRLRGPHAHTIVTQCSTSIRRRLLILLSPSSFPQRAAMMLPTRGNASARRRLYSAAPREPVEEGESEARLSWYVFSLLSLRLHVAIGMTRIVALARWARCSACNESVGTVYTIHDTCTYWTCEIDENRQRYSYSNRTRTGLTLLRTLLSSLLIVQLPLRRRS
jgi:hypothetical protein